MAINVLGVIGKGVAVVEETGRGGGGGFFLWLNPWVFFPLFSLSLADGIFKIRPPIFLPLLTLSVGRRRRRLEREGEWKGLFLP